MKDPYFEILKKRYFGYLVLAAIFIAIALLLDLFGLIQIQ
jgi:hypothetical protein